MFRFNVESKLSREFKTIRDFLDTHRFEVAIRRDTSDDNESGF